MYLIDGRDLNLDGDTNDITDDRLSGDGYNTDTHTASIEANGNCETVNCGRYVVRSRRCNLRVSKSFRIRGTMRVDAIFDVFNLFNALNPGIGTTRPTVV